MMLKHKMNSASFLSRLLLLGLLVNYSECDFSLVNRRGSTVNEWGLLLYGGGTVCDNLFDEMAAEAICLRMGHASAVRWFSASSLDRSANLWVIESSYDIVLSEVRCASRDWTSCSYVTSHSCTHIQDVFLSCDSAADDCTTLDAAWEDVVTFPQLPVDHSTVIKLSCTTGHTNTGGNRATCQNGQILPTDERPLCDLVKASTTTLTVSNNPTKGSPVTLTCIVEGYTAPSEPTLTKDSSSTVTMSCSGDNIKTCTKKFSPAQFTDSGSYKCDGSNTIDNVPQPSSDTLALVINGNVEVSLTQEPVNTEPSQGSSLTFTCKAEGNPNPTKLSLKKGNTVMKSYTGGNDPDIVTGVYSISYVHTINSLSLSHTATYTCDGENYNGGVQTGTASKEISVVSDVVVTITIADKTPAKGSSMSIICVAIGGQKPHFVDLTHDDTSIKSSSDVGFCTDTDDYTLTCTHPIPIVGYADSGKYECIGKNKVAGNAVRTATWEATVSVSKSVSVSVVPASSTEVNFGSSYKITCSVEGGDSPHKVTVSRPNVQNELTWERTEASNTLSCTGQNEVSCEYVISTQSYINDGSFTCTGFNRLVGSSTEYSQPETTSLVIIKDVSVTLTKSIPTDEVEHGKAFTITCVAEGGRIPFYLELTHTAPGSTTPTEIVLYDKDNSKEPATVSVDNTANTLMYTYDTVTSSDYDDSGKYKCVAKNKASGHAVRTQEKIVDIVVVKAVTIDTPANMDTNFGASFTIQFTLNGGRPPHSVQLSNANLHQSLINWSTGGPECSGTNELSCSITIDGGNVDYTYDGYYTILAKNRAKDDVVVTDSEQFDVTVYKDVVASISPESNSDIIYHVEKTITCSVEGGLRPHQVDVTLPVLGTKTWKRDGSSTSLSCTGEHKVVCQYIFTPEYESNGEFKCKGYNKVRNNNAKESEAEVTLTTVRPTEVTAKGSVDFLLTNESFYINCIIVGKPLVPMSLVSWQHSKGLELEKYVVTKKGTADDYTLESTLTMSQPPATFSGSFTCIADNVESQPVEISIAGAEEEEAKAAKTRALCKGTGGTRGYVSMFNNACLEKGYVPKILNNCKSGEGSPNAKKQAFCTSLEKRVTNRCAYKCTGEELAQKAGVLDQ